MKYLCLVYHEQACIDALPGPEYDAIMADVLEYRDELRASGHCLVASSLQPAHTATTIRMRSGRLQMTDGPFAGTAEQLGGFYLIEATDLNDAIRVVARIPSARIGSIEVRPLHDIDPTRPRQERLTGRSHPQ